MTEQDEQAEEETEEQMLIQKQAEELKQTNEKYVMKGQEKADEMKREPTPIKLGEATDWFPNDIMATYY